MTYYQPTGSRGERVMRWAEREGFVIRPNRNKDPISWLINLLLDRLEAAIRAKIEMQLKHRTHRR